MATKKEDVTVEETLVNDAAEEPATGGEPAQGDEGKATASATEGSPDPEEKKEEEKPEEPPAYKPRDKFKVRVFDPAQKDELKLQKEEVVPPWLTPLMKDKDSEEKVIELLEKSFGIEAVKAERTHVKQERDTFRKQLNDTLGQIQDMRKVYQRGDLDLFFDKLAIPQERVLKWALDKVNYSQLPPEQQQEIDRRQTAERQAATLEDTRTSEAAQYASSQHQTKMALVDAGIALPNVSQFAATFDAKAGKPGAFRDEVKATGALAWQTEGIDLSPQQAIEAVMAKWRSFLPVETPAVAPPANAGQPQVVAKPAPTIPNVQGRPSSPLKPRPRSIEDLKKLRDQASAS